MDRANTFLGEYFAQTNSTLGDSMKSHWSYMLTIPLAILAKAVKAARQTSPRAGFARVDALVAELGVAGPDRLCSAAFLTFADMGYGSPTSEQEGAIGAQEVFHGFRDQAPLGFLLDYPRAVVPLQVCENAVLHIPLGGPLFATEEVTPRAPERDSRRGNGPLLDARYESSCINVGRRLRAQRLLAPEVRDSQLFSTQFTYQTGRLLSKLAYLTESDKQNPLDVVRDLRSFLGTQRPHGELGLSPIDSEESLGKVKQFVRA